jgi:hypothetical protein
MDTEAIQEQLFHLAVALGRLAERLSDSEAVEPYDVSGPGVDGLREDVAALANRAVAIAQSIRRLAPVRQEGQSAL